MNEPSPGEETLRHFLLGKLDDAERERIELLFLTDPQSKDRLLAAEQSLLDDYLEDRLAVNDKESFLAQYAVSPGQRRKLRIAKSIKEHAEGEAGATFVDASSSWGRTGWFRLPAKPNLILPVAAVLILALMVGIWFLNRRNQRDAQYSAIERELVSLNDPSSSGTTLPQTSTLSVAPITLRNVASSALFTPRSDIRILELHLLLRQGERPAKYRAVIRKVTDPKEFSFPELPAQSQDPRVIRLRIPTSFLSRGDYQVSLSSIAADGTVNSVEEYNFTVGG